MSQAPAIAMRDVSLRFGSYTALEAVTLAIEPGAFVTLLGPNGAGKSTLLKTALGIIAPTTGTVELFGVAPRSLERQSIGYVPQIKTLDRRFPALAEELVATGLLGRWPVRLRDDARATLGAALQRCGAGHLARRPVGALSGGELQRVYLARAMVRRPRLILLDEPAAGMDVSGEADMYQILESYQQETGATILMITHDWEASQYHASHVLLVNRRLIGFGTPAEVMTDGLLRRAFGHVGHAHAGLLPMGAAVPHADCGHDHHPHPHAPQSGPGEAPHA